MRDRVISAEQIETGLRELGVEAGEALVVHSSLSSFGYVDGGAHALLKAILAAVDTSGTVMVPTMSFQQCALPSLVATPYDPATTPCDRWMGRLPETLRRHPDARRSDHPLVSVAAIGPLAETLVSCQTLQEPYAPYRHLAELGGQVLLLGVGHTSNSTIHSAEYLAGLPHATGAAARPWRALVNTSSGPALLVLHSVAGCSEGFARLDPLVSEWRVLIGSCLARLMPGQAVIDAALALFESEPAPFLCHNPLCDWCRQARMEWEL